MPQHTANIDHHCQVRHLVLLKVPTLSSDTSRPPVQPRSHVTCPTHLNTWAQRLETNGKKPWRRCQPRQRKSLYSSLGMVHLSSLFPRTLQRPVQTSYTLWARRATLLLS